LLQTVLNLPDEQWEKFERVFIVVQVVLYVVSLVLFVSRLRKVFADRTVDRTE
jgi:hypothetical protein